MTAENDRSSGRPIERLLAAGLTGALIGLVLGIAVDASVWLWAFGQALSGQAGVEVPLIVTTDLEHGDVVAESGIGVFILPVACVTMGLLVGLAVGRRSARHAREGSAAAPR